MGRSGYLISLQFIKSERLQYDENLFSNRLSKYHSSYCSILRKNTGCLTGSSVFDKTMFKLDLLHVARVFTDSALVRLKCWYDSCTPLSFTMKILPSQPLMASFLVQVYWQLAGRPQSESLIKILIKNKSISFTIGTQRHIWNIPQNSGSFWYIPFDPELGFDIWVQWILHLALARTAAC